MNINLKKFRKSDKKIKKINTAWTSKVTKSDKPTK